MLTDAQFVQTYRHHMRPLYAYVSHRVGGDRTLAEDLVQDTWLRAITTWPDRGVPDQPEAWLIRVARNLIASHFRRKRPQLVDPHELELADDPFAVDTPSTAAIIGWGLTRLRRPQAELLEAFYLEGKSTRAIAEASGLSERAVEGRLRRARKNLEQRLRPYLRSDSSTAPAVGSVRSSKREQHHA